MKKLFISVVLSTFFLTNSCFGYDFDKDEISCSFSATVFGASSDSIGVLPGFAIGYYLTDNIKVAAELATVFVATEISASLYYYHKIENTDITPYIRSSIGMDDALFSDRLFVYRVSFGVSFPLFSDINGFVGYRPMFSSLFKDNRGMVHALEFGISGYKYPWRTWT